jgi:hypothetical protein
VIRTLSFVVSALGFVASLYGWWFHFSVGDAHGPGFALGVTGAVVALMAGLAGLRMRQSN